MTLKRALLVKNDHKHTSLVDCDIVFDSKKIIITSGDKNISKILEGKITTVKRAVLLKND
jgi:hypothetical protein